MTSSKPQSLRAGIAGLKYCKPSDAATYSTSSSSWLSPTWSFDSINKAKMGCQRKGYNKYKYEDEKGWQNRKPPAPRCRRLAKLAYRKRRDINNKQEKTGRWSDQASHPHMQAAQGPRVVEDLTDRLDNLKLVEGDGKGTLAVEDRTVRRDDLTQVQDHSEGILVVVDDLNNRLDDLTLVENGGEGAGKNRMDVEEKM